MYFNENKYKKCIDHLIAIKTDIVIGYLLLFTLIGGAAGYPIMRFMEKEWYVILIGAIIGAVIGLIIGLCSTWRVEMKIQEAYWNIDVINELQKQTSIANKNAPVAKTVVSIENKQLSEKKQEENQQEKQQENV